MASNFSQFDPLESEMRVASIPESVSQVRTESMVDWDGANVEATRSGVQCLPLGKVNFCRFW